MSTAVQRVFTWQVPIDHATHKIGGGPVILAGSLGPPGLMHVWTVEDADKLRVRWVRVFGTDPIPVEYEYLGSTSPAPFVWHLFEEPR